MSTRKYKSTELVLISLSRIKGNLNHASIMFHTGKRKEFDNVGIEEILITFGIQQSLSLNRISL